MARHTKCPLCTRLIGPDDEVALCRLEEYKRRRRVHLLCFIRRNFTVVSSEACHLSDKELVLAQRLCNWCRGYRLVAEMGRTGQSICPSCHAKLSALFQESKEANKEYY